MIIHVPNKNTLIIDDFKLKCCIGKSGINSNKKEGDYSTPKGSFNLRKLYFRKDRVGIPKCKINKKIIKQDMAWCDDPKHKKYNEEIKTSNKNFKELSMGMSEDYLEAIKNNATYIRVGSKIFGSRA